jgi:hypothetical protein
MDSLSVGHLDPLLWGQRTKLPGVADCPGEDAHVLALAWSIEADIWTTDRDCAGAGIANWSTPTLMRGLGEAEKDRG